MNIRTIKIALAGLVLVAAPALWAQSDMDEAFSKNGVRFVLCTTAADAQLPSPLYAKIGKEYQSVTIGSRTPSPRIMPENGVVKFYSEPPTTSSGNSKPRKAEPVLTIAVPDEHRSHSAKSLCIVQPSKSNDKEPQTFFIKETEFKLGAVHLINFTNSKLEIVTDSTGRFDGHEKHAKVGPRVKTTSISPKDDNVWSYEGKGNAERVSFVLQALPQGGKGEPLRIRASTFRTSSEVAQINIVTKHPTVKNMYTLLSVQYSDDEERAKAMNADGARKR